MKDVILWLDDIRNPYLDIEGKVPKDSGNIIWVINYEQFVQWIEKFGMPSIISFDHDLADEHQTPEQYWNDYQLSKEYQDAQIYTEKTGLDCAKWLVEYCMDNNFKLPKYYVHSANPPGRDNILGLLNNFRNHQLDQLNLIFKELFDKIKHGDQEHQDWLWNEMMEFLKEK